MSLNNVGSSIFRLFQKFSTFNGKIAFNVGTQRRRVEIGRTAARILLLKSEAVPNKDVWTMKRDKTKIREVTWRVDGVSWYSFIREGDIFAIRQRKVFSTDLSGHWSMTMCVSAATIGKETLETEDYLCKWSTIVASTNTKSPGETLFSVWQRQASKCICRELVPFKATCLRCSLVLPVDVSIADTIVVYFVYS